MREFKKRTPIKKNALDSPRETIRRSCRFCRDDIKDIDYKDLMKLQRLVTDKGKILSRRISGNCAKHQRKVCRSIKRARFIALLPYVKR